MVRSLDPNLTAALAALSRVPAISVTAEDHLQHLTLYQSPGVADAWIDATVAADNIIIRCYVNRGGTGFDRTVFYQRITDPSVASQWSTWTALPGGSGNIFMDGGVAISVNPDSTIRIFAQQGTGGNAIWNWYSFDNGASWTGPGVILSPPGGALCAGIASSGNNDVFFSYQDLGGYQIGASFYNGAWGGLITSADTEMISAAGLAVIYTGIYTIVYSDGQSLFSITYNSGSNTWGITLVVTPSTTTAIVRYSPRIAVVDGIFALVCIENDNGSFTGTIYSYPRVRQSSDLIHWSTGYILHAMTSDFGVNFFELPTPNSGSAGSRYYMAATGTVYSSLTFAQDAAHFLDVSASVLSYKRIEQPMKPGKLELVLDNNGGVLNGLVNTVKAPGGYPITPNGIIKLSEGYKTGTPPSSPDVILIGTYHIQQIVFSRTPEQNALHLICYDLSRNLDLQNRWQITWFNQTVGWLVTEVCARAGLFNVSAPGTSQMSQVIPTFVLLAGQTYRSALNELCTTYGLGYYMDQDEAMQFRELKPTDPIVWTFSPEIELVAFGTDDLVANHVIVSGKPPAGTLYSLTQGETYDDSGIALVQIERMLHHTDQKLTTPTQAALKAQFLLLEEQRAQQSHQVEVPANPALQIYDGVQLIDSVAPVGSGQNVNARIMYVESEFDAETATYEMVLHLQGL